MAMTMNGQVQLAARWCWAKLNDPEVLKSCIPGSEQLDKISENEFQAIATVEGRTGQGALEGEGEAFDLSIRRTAIAFPAKGRAASAGFAQGGAKVSLSDKDGGTLLTYDVEAQIGGKLAATRATSHQQRGKEDCRGFLRKISPPSPWLNPVLDRTTAWGWLQSASKRSPTRSLAPRSRRSRRRLGPEGPPCSPNPRPSGCAMAT